MAALLELTQKPFIELQIEALAEENRIKPKRATKFIEELKSRILAIKDLNYVKLLNRTFRLPIIGRPNSMNDDYPQCFKFIPPEQFHIIGGFTTQTALKRTNHIDLAIIIPSQCFEKKDVKNQRYHHKRALYLAQIAHLLNGSTGFGLVDKIEYRYHQGDFLKPVVIITPKSAKLQNITFQLFACPETNFAIKTSLLQPLHGNIAPKWFFKDYEFNCPDDEIKEFILHDSDATASPFYNSSILFDMEVVSNSTVISEQIGSESSIREALMLSKIWLYQRELHQHFSFILSMFVAYLQTKQAIHQNMSSYQIFKVIIKSIVSIDWSTDGLSYYEDSKDKIGSFKSVFPVVFLSPSGNMNLCYNITIDLYRRLRHEAEIAQNVLSANCPDTFEQLFLKRLDFVSKFDVIVHIPKCTKKLPEKLDYIKSFMDHGVFVPRVYSKNILNLVYKALSDRIILLQQSPDHLLLDKTWSLKGIAYDPTNQEHTFTLGLLLDAEKSLRIIDIGPDAQSQEAEKFREFWDPKCQLRLQNGIISETVVWHVDSFSQRRAIIKYILTHALKRANLNNIVVHYTLLERFISLQNVYFKWRDEVLDDQGNNENKNSERSRQKQHQQRTNGSQKRKHHDNEEEEEDSEYEEDETTTSVDGDKKVIEGKPLGVGEEVFQKILHCYNELNKILRSIDKLKHSITSIQPTSAHLRACGVFPPMPVSLQQRNKSLKRRKGVTLFPEDFNQVGKILYIEPIEILVTLESSGKWPSSDLEALEAAKLDYLLELGSALQAREYSTKFSESDYMDLLYGQFVFRIRVKLASSKELALISTARGKQEFQRRRLDYEVMPRVHAFLDQLYREKPAFGLTCRLVKRWIACHLMTNHISDITLELIVAHIFQHPHPYTEPASSACGFRRFLKLIAQHDWHELPLVVNHDNQLKLDEINKIKDAMSADRSKYPAMVVCTPFDREITSPWTRPEPGEAKLQLLRKICSKALEFYNKQICNKFDVADECKSLFRPNFKIFHLLIKLKPQVIQTFFMGLDIPKTYQICGKEPTAKRASALRVMPVVGLNVVEQFVGVLRDNFDQVAEFYFDKYGQKVIGVMMRDQSERILEGNMSKFIRDIKKLGSKLVDSVSVLKND